MTPTSTSAAEKTSRREVQAVWNTPPVSASTCTSAPARGTGKKSKTECLLCPAPPTAYTDPNTYDRSDLSDIDMGNGNGKSIQVVYRCPSLGTITSGDSSCDHEVSRRILLGNTSMEKMNKKVYGSKYVPRSTQVAI
jgi:hypothetical protein